MKRLLAAAIIVTIAVLLILAYQKVNRKSQATVQGDIFFSGGTAGIKDFAFYQTDINGITWQITASRADFFENQEKAKLKDVKGLIKTDKVNISFEGEMALINTKTKNFTFQKENGVVLIQLEGGMSLRSKKFSWNNDKEQLSTEDPVTIISDNIKVTGEQLKAYPKTGEIHLETNVKAIFTDIKTR